MQVADFRVHFTLQSSAMAVAYARCFHTQSEPQTIANYSGTDAVSTAPAPEVESAYPVFALHVSARDLRGEGGFGISRRFCVFCIHDSLGDREVARTEVVCGNPNPDWSTFFRALYICGTYQWIVFKVYECSDPSAPLDYRHYIGWRGRVKWHDDRTCHLR
jgi:hypothetical protein